MSDNLKIPDGWKETTLGEVAFLQRGFDLPTLNRRKGRYPLIASNGQDGLIDEYRINAPGVVTGRSGTIGKVFLIKENFWPLNTTLWVKEFYNNDVKFVYYLLNTIPFEKFNTGSGVPTLNRNYIHPFKVLLPPLPEQKAIADVLSSFDNKIELLREQNKTLEAIAQTIFNEWFVRFNFPDENGKPYQASGGKMIDSELGPIPEGWRVGKLGEEIETILGGTPNTNKDEYWKNGNIPWINSGKVNEFRICEPTSYITENALNKSAAKLMPKGTVVIAITGATLGQVSRLEIDSTGNQSVIGIIPNTHFSSAFLFYWTLANISTIVGTATGGAQQHINKNDVNCLDFIFPFKDILTKHHFMVSSILDKISSNCLQIQTLSKLREDLMPKLMKGELRAVF